ncbi:organomercurial lyase [Candidatus Leptofilum sp.]|uniref:organomercurial lyase n=1 Tax=Candidatus Leptofilum sp. TaxID=3241576 RepID=UPI003B5B324A
MISDLDLAVRTFVYQHFVQTARPPSVAETAVHLNLPPNDIEKSYQRLHDNHFFFLEPGTLSIRMANPFSAIPTKFKVHIGKITYWANCAWDMLGIPAAMQQDATMTAIYEDSGEISKFTVKNGQLQPGEGVIHFPLPVKQWYDDLILT